MNIKELITAPRYRVCFPENKCTQTVEYTSVDTEGFKISATIILEDHTFKKVEEPLKDYKNKGIHYLQENNLDLLSVLLEKSGDALSYLIKFAWTKEWLKGSFYLNIKRTLKNYHTTVTSFTKFHLGNPKMEKNW